MSLLAALVFFWMGGACATSLSRVASYLSLRREGNRISLAVVVVPIVLWPILGPIEWVHADEQWRKRGS